jgi:histidine triad (HIT) family protein
MAGEANTLKAWLVPVATAAYGFAVVNRSWPVALLGIAATFVMGWQSAHYLRQERAYRALYAAAAKPGTDVTLFDMNPSPYCPRWFGKRSVLSSWSIVGFFGALILAGVFAAVVGACSR